MFILLDFIVSAINTSFENLTDINKMPVIKRRELGYLLWSYYDHISLVLAISILLIVISNINDWLNNGLDHWNIICPQIHDCKPDGLDFGIDKSFILCPTIFKYDGLVMGDLIHYVSFYWSEWTPNSISIILSVPGSSSSLHIAIGCNFLSSETQLITWILSPIKLSSVHKLSVRPWSVSLIAYMELRKFIFLQLSKLPSLSPHIQ